MASKDYGDRLAGYTEVKDRIPMFYEQHPEGRLVTDVVKVTTKPDGIPRVWVKALAYRTPDDPHPGVGWSWMVLPGTTPYTRGSELENTETSAWGRAIGSLSIGIGAGFATKDEIAAKAGEDERPTTQVSTSAGSDGLIGTVHTKAEWLNDFELRQTPDGSILGFRLKEGRKEGLKVVAKSPLAETLAAFKDEIVGQTVTCWGVLMGEEFTPKGTRRNVSYQVLYLSRIKGPFGEFPAPDSPPSEAASDPVAPGQETLPLTDEEKGLIAGGLPGSLV